MFLTKTQTINKVKSVGTQCDLYAPPLQRLPQATSLNDSLQKQRKQTCILHFILTRKITQQSKQSIIGLPYYAL